MNARAGMPSKKLIQNWWVSNTDMFDLPLIENKNHQWVCWGCGFESLLERCHIRAVCDGGGNDASNLVLLCKFCHSLQEQICQTEIGRKKFIDDILDGAPFMTDRMRLLHAMACNSGLIKQGC